ncbi:MAG: adenosine-specific kinase [Cuniculiplasma sp.]
MSDLEEIKLEIPEGCNMIIGYSHFIKTVEDLEEIIRTVTPGSFYSIAFSEASGERLIRHEGNDEILRKIAINNLRKLSCGHTFIILLKNAFPIAILNAIKNCQEVGNIFAATANPISAIVYRGENGGSVLGVIDGYSPLGVETDSDREKRRDLLRKIGYKR